MSKLYNEYLRLKQEDSSKLYLFRCGNFYIFLAEDCDFINEYVVLKKVRFSKDVFKCGFPINVLDNYLRVFQNHKLKIEVIEQIDTPDIYEWVKKIDIDSITPIEALFKLKEIKDMIK